MESWTGPRVGIVIDCNDLPGMARFWAAALQFEQRGDAGHYRSLASPRDDEPRIILQLVGEPRVGKNRLHIDLHADDLEGTAQRLVGLGATRIDAEPVDEVGSRWIRLTDPEGNEFCVVQARTGGDAGH